MVNSGRAKRAIIQSIEPLESRVLFSTIVVNTTIDGLFPPSTGLVSLRNAVATANSSPTSTEIDFDATVFATRQMIALNGNGLVLSAAQPISLMGPAAGLTINGNGQGTTIQVATGRVSVSGIEITGGTNRGGIENDANLFLSNVLISGNTCAVAGGGGVYNGSGASLTLDRVTISSNLGAGYGGAGLYNDGTVTLQNTTIEGNTSEGGGGGISNQNAGTAHLMNVTVSRNVSAFGGAGIDNDNNASITLDNVTVANNTAGYGGGGVYNRSNATLTNTTIWGNAAPGGAGIYNASGHTITVSNTIIAGNTLSGTGNTGPDVFGSLNSLGYNLIGETDGSTGWNTYDLTGTAAAPLDPKLSPLGNFGGPTQTMALLLGSPALNAGWSALAVDANDNPLATDQRGLPRIYGPSVDIGAYESQPPALAGDVNHDGTVNLADLLLLTRDFGKSTPMYEGGDLDGDGSVGISDFLDLTRNFGRSAAAAVSSRAFESAEVPTPRPSAINRRELSRRRISP